MTLSCPPAGDRAERLLESVEEDVVERGYVSLRQMFMALHAGDLPRALERAGDMVERARRFADPDLLAIGLAAMGRVTVYSGDVRTGLALFDEAMVGVAAGEVSAIFAGEAYCVMIEGCQEVGDLGRAAAWTEALHRWCQAQPGLVAFTGQCAVHRGQIMALRGAYREAIEEYAHAIPRYVSSRNEAACGLAHAERGDAHRVLGELDAAEAAYEAAAGHGYEPQPGLALLWVARGRQSAAVGAVRRLLAEVGDPVSRSRLLVGAVEVLRSCEQPTTDLVEELEAIASSFDCASLVAAAAYARGRVALDTGDAAGALPYLRKASSLWTSLDAPYEVARVRVEIGRALAALGDGSSASLELTVARRTFEALGTRPALEQVDSLLVPASLPGGLTAREVEVLRLVATGRSNTQIAAELVLSDKTVARHLSNIFGKLDVGSRTAAAAYAFEHGLA
ncbi:DNA-binding NarL/FixJ family response regulator [Nocardioides ginsengisegetis]|uniref:DNA-binding NarL/FixJ family response regulator n=1 Tax=Nocardioides ginsengisegetis TaxID=661491 RepID=A0A7W3J1C1_9ACTN|nr:DNA-binding NarL/FixJ family response regulator [Nocardioides ginsengisegetis]